MDINAPSYVALLAHYPRRTASLRDWTRQALSLIRLATS
jgi:hypothetical protein